MQRRTNRSMENQDDADDDLSDEIDEYSATVFDSDNDNDEDDTEIENREFNQKAHRGSDNEDMNSNETESINELDDMNNSDNEGIDEDEANEDEDGEGIDSNLSENEDDMEGNHYRNTTGRKSKGFMKSYESYNEEDSENDLMDTNTGKGKTNKRMKSLMYKVKSKAGNQSNAANNNSNQHGIEFPIESEPIYCVCSEISYGQMICCDNDSCKIEWFHFECVKLNSKPKGKWYCPHCRGDTHKVMRKFVNSESTSNLSYTSSYRIK